MSPKLGRRPRSKRVIIVCMFARLLLALSWSLLTFQQLPGPPPATDSAASLLAAREDFRARRFMGARAQLTALIAREPGNTDARYLVVRTFIEENIPDEALREAEVAIQQCPRDATAHTALGDALYRLGDFDKAAVAYEEALRLNSQDARAHLGLGRVLLTDFRFKSGREHLESAQRLSPHDPDVASALASVLPRSPAQLDLEEQYAIGATYRNPEEVEANKALISLFRVKGGRQPFVLQDPPDQLSLRLRGVRMGVNGPPSAFVLAVAVNAGEPHNLLVDTAAHGLLISSRMAARSGVTPLLAYRLGGLGNQGRMPASLGWAESATIGDLRLSDCPVIITDKKVGPRWDGIIGTDVFREFLITLDFPGRSLRLEKLPPRKDDEFAYDRSAVDRSGFARVRFLGWKLLARTGLNGGVSANFVIDTGASERLIAQRTAQKITTLIPSRRGIRGISGDVGQTLQAENVVLQFPGLQRTPETMLAVDMTGLSYALGTELGGLIGCPQLADASLTIDYREGLVKITK